MSKAIFVRCGGALAALLMSVAVARNLDPEDAGYFFLLFSTISFFRVFNLFGMHQVGMKFISRFYSEGDVKSVSHVSSMAFSLTAVISLFTCLLLFSQSTLLATAYWEKPELADPIKIAAIVCVFGSLLPLIAHFFQGVGMELFSIFLMTLLVPALTGVFIFCLSIAHLEDALYALLAATAITVLFSGYFWFTRIKIGALRSDRVTWVILCGTGFNLWLVGLLVTISQQGVQILAARWLTGEAVSILAVSMQLKASVALILVAVNVILAPKISIMFNEGKYEAIKSIVWKGVIASSVYAAPLLLFVFIFAGNVLEFLFGAEYVTGATVLRILILGEAANVLVGPVGVLLSMTNNDAALRNISIFVAIISVAFLLILAPIYGVVGAAVTISIAAIVKNFLSLLLVRQKLGFFTITVWKLIGER